MRATDCQLGPVTVLLGEKSGKYPDGNSLLIRGRDSTVLVDPSLSVEARAAELAGATDLIVQSHVHEDHVVGLHHFPNAEVHAHREDAPGLRSLDGLMAIYGYEGQDEEMRTMVVSHFHFTARPDVRDFDDDATFDLGGIRLRAIHMPGHTRGHCALLVEPEGVLFIGDIDLSSFGPYYGDAWSNLEDFEHSLRRVREIDARVWVSSHHVGVIEDRATFLDKLQRYTARIGERDQTLLDFLDTPRQLSEMVTRRLLFPPQLQVSHLDAIERRAITQHLDRLLAQGQIERCDGDLYRRIKG